MKVLLNDGLDRDGIRLFEEAGIEVDINKRDSMLDLVEATLRENATTEQFTLRVVEGVRQFISDFDVDPANLNLIVVRGSPFVELTVWLYSLHERRFIKEIFGQGSGPQKAIFSADGEKIFCFGNGGIYVYDMLKGRTTTVFSDRKRIGKFCNWSPDGHQLAFTIQEGIQFKLAIVDIDNKKLIELDQTDHLVQ